MKLFNYRSALFSAIILVVSFADSILSWIERFNNYKLFNQMSLFEFVIKTVTAVSLGVLIAYVVGLKKELQTHKKITLYLSYFRARKFHKDLFSGNDVFTEKLVEGQISEEKEYLTQALSNENPSLSKLEIEKIVSDYYG